MTTRTTRKTRPAPRTDPDVPALISELRNRWKLTVRDLARISGFSERSITGWEAGAAASGPAVRRLTEVRRLLDSIAELVQPEAIPAWLHQPNPAFGELKPLEVIERGETDRLWRMIFYLESGTPT